MVGSPPPFLAATMMARDSFDHSLPRLASVAPFLCLIVAQWLWPDMMAPCSVVNRSLLTDRLAPNGLSPSGVAQPIPPADASPRPLAIGRQVHATGGAKTPGAAGGHRERGRTGSTPARAVRFPFTFFGAELPLVERIDFPAPRPVRHGATRITSVMNGKSSRIDEREVVVPQLHDERALRILRQVRDLLGAQDAVDR